MQPAGLSFLPRTVAPSTVSSVLRSRRAAARTCYSGGGIVTADWVAGAKFDEAARRRALSGAMPRHRYFQAGHHTVFQHAHFQFALSNVSRQFVWSFLHAHPFYNSEQVSQRYVAVQPAPSDSAAVRRGASAYE